MRSGMTSASSYSNSFQGSYPSLTTGTSPITSTSNSASALSLHESYRFPLAVSLDDEPTPSNAESWARWLANNAPLHIQEIHSHIRLEEVFQSNQTMVLISVPVSVWSRLPDSSAYRFIDFITGDNLLNKSDPATESTAVRNKNAETESVAKEKRGPGRRLVTRTKSRLRQLTSTRTDDTTFQEACSLGRENLMLQMLDAGVDINAKHPYLGTAVEAASLHGYGNIVRKLIAKGADLNAQNERYGNALWAASSEGHGEIVRMLLNAGADVNVPNKICDTALWAASPHGDEETVRLLHDAGAEVSARDSRCGAAIQKAAVQGHGDVVRLLIAREADIDAHSEQFGTVLQEAELNGYTDIAQVLLENGARRDIKTRY